MTELQEYVIRTPLGKKSNYVSVYTPSLLCPLPRRDGRDALKIDSAALPFRGMDVWTGYELSWLDTKGKPHVGIGQFFFPCTSPFLVESKSFKLYLNSFNQTRFNNTAEVLRTIESDLSTAVGGTVLVNILPLSKAAHEGIGHFAAENIDALDTEIDVYSVNPEFLETDAQSTMVRESICSDLLKTNCPVTGQPDWASVMISYRGRPIDRPGLLKYIVSFREHKDFHENCVERIFMDIKQRCQPEVLTVSARYTRRGGLEINPWRSTQESELPQVRLVRQ
jgi:7-cyano-7-deazaguanine reductase